MTQNIERLSPPVLMERIVTFAKLQPEQGVSNFVIQGPIEKSPRVVDTAVGLFPYAHPALVPGYAIVSVKHAGHGDMALWNGRIKTLTLPDRVLKLGIPDNHILSMVYSSKLARNGMPTIALLFGWYQETNHEFVQLFCAAGISPSTALSELKTRATERLISLQ